MRCVHVHTHTHTHTHDRCRLFLKDPSYPLRDPRAFADKLTEAVLETAAASAQQLSSPQPPQHPQQQRQQQQQQQQQHTLQGSDQPPQHPQQQQQQQQQHTLQGSDQPRLVLLCRCLVALLQQHVLLGDHLTTTGLLPRYLNCANMRVILTPC